MTLCPTWGPTYFIEERWKDLMMIVHIYPITYLQQFLIIFYLELLKCITLDKQILLLYVSAILQHSFSLERPSLIFKWLFLFKWLLSLPLRLSQSVLKAPNSTLFIKDQVPSVHPFLNWMYLFLQSTQTNEWDFSLHNLAQCMLCMDFLKL